MNNWGMGQKFNPHMVRGKTVGEVLKKYEDQKWYDEDEEKKKDNQFVKKFDEER